MKRIKPVDNWSKCWKWFSVQANALNAGFLASWALLPEKFQDSLPTPYAIGISIALLILGTLGRLIKQEDH